MDEETQVLGNLEVFIMNNKYVEPCKDYHNSFCNRNYLIRSACTYAIMLDN